MRLPLDVLQCLEALEGASFATYAVGGCVRDHLLGLQPHDFDLCTAATPDEIQAVFSDRQLVLAGLKHGTVGIVTDSGVVEITTFRSEGGYTDCRHPGWVKFVPTIEEDLARRDFTVNAMAWSPSRGLCDPFGGAADLKNKILRAVGDPMVRFQEDALRILRGTRFAAKFRLTVEEATEAAMFRQVPLLDGLARERIFDELCKLILLANAADLIHWAPIITQAIPELEPTVGFEQHSPYHAYDLYTHIAHVTAATAPDLPLRWAALLHDVGKPGTFSRDENGRGHFYGHAKVGASLTDGILHRLKAPTALREQVVQLVEQHMNRLEPERKLLRRRLSRLGEDSVKRLLALQEADMGSKGTEDEASNAYFTEIRRLLAEIKEENACLTLKDLAVKGSDLIRMGYLPGKALGRCLQRLLELVLDEKLPNDRAALLAAAETYLQEETP